VEQQTEQNQIDYKKAENWIIPQVGSWVIKKMEHNNNITNNYH
jgi:hypothetical protein